MQKLKNQQKIKAFMQIDNYLNPINKRVVNNNKHLLQSITESYAINPAVEQAFESDEEEQIEPKIKISEALNMV